MSKRNLQGNLWLPFTLSVKVPASRVSWSGVCPVLVRDDRTERVQCTANESKDMFSLCRAEMPENASFEHLSPCSTTPVHTKMSVHTDHTAQQHPASYTRKKWGRGEFPEKVLYPQKERLRGRYRVHTHVKARGIEVEIRTPVKFK